MSEEELLIRDLRTALVSPQLFTADELVELLAHTEKFLYGRLDRRLLVAFGRKPKPQLIWSRP